MQQKICALAVALALTALVGAIGCRRAEETASPAHGRDAPAPATQTTASYVGRAQCARCHQAEEKRWQGSHHDLAMQEATPATVLGNFADATFTYAGTTTRFSQRDGRYVVRTDGPDGQLRDYDVAYVFGVYPLQQYLIGFPDGRYQALSIAWDSRTKAEGGQRWYHLYPDEKVTHADVLHWTKFSQNWNAQCAVCHSTNLRKGFDRTTNTYKTTWSEMDVSCETCHGPASAHVAWANTRASRQSPRRLSSAADMGLTVSLRERRNVRVDDAGGQRHRESEPRARRAARGSGDLRAVPRPSIGTIRRARAWPAVPHVVPAGVALRRAVPRGRADAGRGLQLRLVPPEQDACGRRDVLGLSRPAQPEAEGRRQRRLRAVPSADDLRRARPITGTRQERPARPAWPATCPPRRTWASIAGTITASACRGRTSPSGSARPTPVPPCHANRSAAWASAALDRWRTPTWRQRPHFAETFASGPAGQGRRRRRADGDCVRYASAGHRAGLGPGTAAGHRSGPTRALA